MQQRQLRIDTPQTASIPYIRPGVAARNAMPFLAAMGAALPIGYLVVGQDWDSAYKQSNRVILDWIPKERTNGVPKSRDLRLQL